VTGHEYPRALLLSMLMQEVPGRLDAIKARLTADPEAPVTWPPTPNGWLLADRLPQREDYYPAVIVSSTQGRLDQAVQSGLGVSGEGDFIWRYDLTIGVAVIATRHGGDDEASIGRDRILLACREAVMLNPKLSDSCRLILRGLSETTGAAVEDLQSRAMALGNLSVGVEVTETLTDQLGVVTESSTSITAHDAADPDIVPAPPTQES
jgi:hypothetical protein